MSWRALDEKQQAMVDAVIMAIVDTWEVEGDEVYRKE